MNTRKAGQSKKNTPEPEQDTEQRILAAARAEFADRGLDGARMQSIADRARVNKALLHYYFRSKEKLFERSLRDLGIKVWSRVRDELSAQPGTIDLRALIKAIVSAYINTFAANPDFPRVLMRELANGGQNLHLVVQEVIEVLGDIPAQMLMITRNAHQKNLIKRFEPLHLMMNIMGMCAATFFFKPVSEILKIKVGLDIEYNEAFFTDRIRAITEMACDGIFIKGKAK